MRSGTKGRWPAAVQDAETEGERRGARVSMIDKEPDAYSTTPLLRACQTVVTPVGLSRSALNTFFGSSML